MIKRLIAVSLLALSAVACNTWERSSFQTLSASKAVLDTAQTDYGNRTIPQTPCSFALINNGKAAQTAAVDGMIAYEQLKATKGNTTATEAQVTADLASLAPIVVQIQALIANPASCTTPTGAAK
jgi:hypothetical protein